MDDKHTGDKKYFKLLADAVYDQRVQKYWFNMLIRRDLSQFNRRDIPVTQLHTEVKEERMQNVFLVFMKQLVTGELHKRYWKKWYKRSGVPDDKQYYQTCVVERWFDEWCQNVKKKRVDKTFYIHALLKSHDIWKSHPQGFKYYTYDAKALPQKKQRQCYRCNKDGVRLLYRTVLNDPNWDFPNDDGIALEEAKEIAKEPDCDYAFVD